MKKYKKNVFSGLCQKFPQATDEVKNFFCHFPSPWVLRMSGMGGYGQKCEKMPKSLHLNEHKYNTHISKPSALSWIYV